MEPPQQFENDSAEALTEAYGKDHTPLKTRLLVGAILIALIAGGLAALVHHLEENKPQAKVEQAVRPLLTVITERPAVQDVPVVLEAEGQVQPVRDTLVASEVMGRVKATSPKFKAGERFKEGEPLVEIDQEDFKNAIAQATAALADAKLQMETEQAMSEQAVRDWNKLSAGKPMPALVKRDPQLASAKARVDAATAALAKAERDLEKAEVKAPFDGVIRMVHTEIGSFLSPGAPVADFFATGHYEIPLSLPLDDTVFLPDDPSRVTTVTVQTVIGGIARSWEGRIVRKTGEMDRTTRTITVVAEVRETDGILQPGLYLDARIPGVTLEKVVRIPRLCFLDSERVIVVDKEDRIAFRTVTVVRKEPDDVLTRGGLAEGDRLCLTRLANPLEGMRVSPREAETDKPAFTNP